MFGLNHKKGALLLAATVLVAVQTNSGLAGNLIKNEQKVQLVLTEGSMKGTYTHTLRENSGTFGPTNVIEHTSTTLVFRGKRDTCTMTSDGKLSCQKIGTGYWTLK